MPLRPLPFREVKRKLEAAGFVEVSSKGSHFKFAKKTSQGTYTAVACRITEKYPPVRCAVSYGRPVLTPMSLRVCKVP
jgi:predicted RNA binding protein YcfA (HicA-like mRNA interferase family)